MREGDAVSVSKPLRNHSNPTSALRLLPTETASLSLALRSPVAIRAAGIVDDLTVEPDTAPFHKAAGFAVGGRKADGHNQFQQSKTVPPASPKEACGWVRELRLHRQTGHHPVEARNGPSSGPWTMVVTCVARIFLASFSSDPCSSDSRSTSLTGNSGEQAQEFSDVRICRIAPELPEAER